MACFLDGFLFSNSYVKGFMCEVSRKHPSNFSPITPDSRWAALEFLFKPCDEKETENKSSREKQF